ncbi:NHLP bacteriocin system secretion protein [Estrella lausannensis]|uniref:ABC-type transporter, substrate-binding protein n=1 Tax=Estrella lausannensis TaxID=483423 RepID=A0A0H5DPG9_9BACT|nr:NHLP bacteriocin system secretion protein [Estrella lausannensis]CRX38337.1 ABC-type transporter, substrate-binding protein [Estrella lausannensis]
MSEEAEPGSHEDSLIDKMGETLAVVDTKSWLAIIALGGILTFLLLWSIFGKIPIKAEGLGIILNEKGVFSVESTTPGIVQKIFVKKDDRFTAGENLIELLEPEEELKLQAAELKLTTEEAELARLKTQVGEEYKAEVLAMHAELKALEFNQEKLLEEIPKLKEVSEKKRSLYEKGLISLQALRDAEFQVSEREINLEKMKASISSLKAKLAKEYRTEEIKGKEQEVLAAKENYELLMKRKELALIKAPQPGKVLEVNVREGTFVAKGEAVIWSEHVVKEGDPILIYSYVSADMGKRINPGAKVNVELLNVNPQEFGMMNAEVLDVSLFAISANALEKTLQNATLSQYLMGSNRAVLQIIAKPVADHSTPSGFSWTSGSGPQEVITTGTLAKIKVIIEEVRPISYLFPVWKLKSALDQSPEKDSKAVQKDG